jgi:hypothetical protein
MIFYPLLQDINLSKNFWAKKEFHRTNSLCRFYESVLEVIGRQNYVSQGQHNFKTAFYCSTKKNNVGIYQKTINSSLLKKGCPGILGHKTI